MNAKLLALPALLLAALIAFALLTKGSSETGEPAAAETLASRLETPATEPRDLASLEPAGASREQLTDASASAAATAELQAEEDAPGTELRGRVLLLTDSGQRVENTSGTIEFSWGFEHSRGRLEAEVVDGRFAVEAPDVPISETTLELRFGVLDGLAVMPVERPDGAPSGTSVGEDGEFLLECTPRGAIELEVRDAATGELVDGVDIAAGDWQTVHPGNRPDLLVENAPSPVRIDLLELQRREDFLWGSWLVGGPGYAWKQVEIDPRGERAVVQLESAGALEVEVVGLAATKRLELFVTTPDYEMRYERPLRADGRYLLERWPAGPVEAAVHRGQWFQEPKVYGEASGEVAVGETLALRIEVDAEAAAPLVTADLELEVLVPAGWDFEALTLSLDLKRSPAGIEANLIEQAEPEAEPWGQGGQRFLFELGPRHVGTWLARFDPGKWRALVELEQPGRLELIFPAPADVTVTAIDPSTGAPVDDVRLSWFCTLEEDRFGGSRNRATALPEPGQHRFRAPATRVVLAAEHDGYGRTERTIQLEPGARSIELEMQPLVGFELSLMEGESPVPIEGWDFRPMPYAPGAERPPAGLMLSPRDGKLLFWLPEPGLYELRFPEFTGFASIEPVMLDLQPVEVQVVSLR